MYLLRCNSCDKTTPVASTQAGGTIPCESCGNTNQIPTLGQLRKLEQQDSGEKGADARSGGSDRVGSRIGFVAFGFLTIAALLITCFCAVYWQSSGEGKTTETHIQEIRDEYKTIDPALLVVHFEVVEERPLEVSKPFTYHLEHMEKLAWKHRALGGLITTLICGSLAALFAFRLRSKVA